MKKPVIAPGDVGRESRWVDDPDFAAEYPNLYAFLSDSLWDDGSKRVTGSMLLCVDAGVLKCWVNDKAYHRSAWVSSPSFTGLLRLLDDRLGDDALPWRPDAKKGGR